MARQELGPRQGQLKLASRGALSSCPVCRRTTSWLLRQEENVLGLRIATIATCGNCGFMSAHDPQILSVPRPKAAKP